MIDLSQWLPGLTPDPEEEDPVTKTLRALGQVPAALGDIGRTAGQSVVGAVSGAGQALADAYAVPVEERPPQYSGPSYAQPTREEAGQPPIGPWEPLQQLGAGAAAGVPAAVAAAQRAYEDPNWATVPALPRAINIGSQAAQAFGGEVGRVAPEAMGFGTEPIIDTPETPIDTPLGRVTVPPITVTPQDVGRFAGSVLADPTTYVGAVGAQGRAADLVTRNLLGGAARAAAAPFRAAGRAVTEGAEALADTWRTGSAPARAFSAADEALAAPGVQHLGSGIVPETGLPRPGWTPPPALPDEEVQQFRRAGRLSAAGQPLPPELPVVTREMPARTTAAQRRAAAASGEPLPTVPLKFFVTSTGEEVVLPPAGRGGQGQSDIATAYSDYISAQGGHRGRPSGRYQAADGTWKQYDSPQELLFMQDFDAQVARGAVATAEHGGLEAWWRSGESPYPEIESLPYIKTTMKPGEQAGVAGFEGDYVLRHRDGFVELVEGKDVKVIPKQEEWFQEPGKRPALAWNVLRKAAAAIPELAMQGRGFRMVVGRDSAGMVPTLGPSPVTGRGEPVKSFWGVPGVDVRDIPELDRGFPSPGPAVGNQILDVVLSTEREARDLAARLRAAGVPPDEQRARLTRLVRDRFLPTADLAGRTTGEMRNVQGGVSAAVPAWNGPSGRLLRDALEAEWPEAAAAVRSAEEQGATIRAVSVERVQGPADAAPSPRLFLETDGDPAAIQRLAAQLGEAHGDPGAATVWHYDWQGPTSVREVSFTGADPAIQASFDDVQAALRAAGDQGIPGLVSRYNQDGSLATVHVLGQDAAGNPIPDRVVDGLLHRVRAVLAEFGVQADVGDAQRAVVRNFASEGDYARALDLHEQSLGLRPLAPPPRGTPSAADGGGAPGGGRAAGGGGEAPAAARPDRLADLDQPPPGTPDAALGSGATTAPRIGAGRFGVVRADAFNAAQGGVLGAVSEDMQAQSEGRESDPEERIRRALIAGGLALAGGRSARPVAAGARALGSGVVPPVDPDEIADLARRAASAPRTPATRTNGAPRQTVRNVARQIQQQSAAGVAPQVPTGPMPPPDPPPGWWDHAENWRYNLGLLSQVSTGMVQAAGGLVEAIGGGSAEAIRLALLRGQPEALPLILGEGIRAIPGAVASSLRTVAGQVPEAIEAGSDYRPSLGARERAAGHPVRGAVADVIGVPGRTVTQAPDAFWYEIFYRTGLSQAAADAAGRQAGRSPTAALERARIQRDLTANPTPEIEAEAARLAQDATYKGEPGALLGGPKAAGKALTAGIPSTAARNVLGAAGSFLMPFYNTIARIHERALEYTPGVGLLPLEQLGAAGAGRSRPMDRRLAQQAVGVAFVSSGLAYAAQGGIRGPGPANPNEAQAMRDQGYTPNSTNVGGYWVPNTWFGPWGPILNEIGAVNDARLYDHGDKRFDDLTYWQKADALVKMSARALRDYPALDAAATATQLFTRPTEALTSFVGEVGAQYVPGIIRTEATRADPLARTRTRGDEVPPEQRIEETFRQRSGIGRQQLPAAQDILGRDVANPRQGARAYLPRLGQDTPDPIIGAFVDNHVAIGDPPKQLTIPNLRSDLDAPELTPTEQRRWNTLRGDAIIRLVGPVLAEARFTQAKPEERVKFLEQKRTEAAAYAHRTLRSEIGEDALRRRIEGAKVRKAGAA